MKDIIDAVAEWVEVGVPFAVATVVRTWNSAPRPVGASLAVADSGEVVGSVSGGCVEGAVVEVAQQVLLDGAARLVQYGVADASAFAVGLTCGGTIELFVTRADEDLRAVITELARGTAEHRPLALVTVVAGADAAHGERLLVDADGGVLAGAIADEGLRHAAIQDAVGRLTTGETSLVHVGRHGERRREQIALFVESYTAPPRMLVFGAIDFAAAVARMGAFLGYHVTVCDARAMFATPARFPDAHEVVVDWPHRYLDSVPLDERSVLCLLTHDPKFDVPLLMKALRRPARYIGAMGSRRTHEDRLAKLRAEGLTDAELARLRSPIGLDLGGRTPEETAVSIAAEIIALTWDGTGRPLSELRAPIHRESLASADPEAR